MNIDEYNEEQRQVSATLVALVIELLNPFKQPKLSDLGWESLLAVIYGPTRQARRKSAALGRRFYDSERLSKIGVTKFINLASYRPEWFREAMQPVRDRMTEADSDDDDITVAVLRVAKEAENGGRRTIRSAVDDDPEVGGWARVATGRETCAFCLMLVSRGPVYLSAESAGLSVDDTSAVELIDQGDSDSLDQLMTRWHPGCDCKVVPVFDRDDWPGRDTYRRAEQIWQDTTKGYSGRDALNAFRRAIERGDVSPTDFSASK